MFYPLLPSAIRQMLAHCEPEQRPQIMRAAHDRWSRDKKAWYQIPLIIIAGVVGSAIGFVGFLELAAPIEHRIGVFAFFAAALLAGTMPSVLLATRAVAHFLVP